MLDGSGSNDFTRALAHRRTVIMAKDALALMDHLGWRRAHVFGHSMGKTIPSFLLIPSGD